MDHQNSNCSTVSEGKLLYEFMKSCKTHGEAMAECKRLNYTQMAEVIEYNTRRVLKSECNSGQYWVSTTAAQKRYECEYIQFPKGELKTNPCYVRKNFICEKTTTVQLSTLATPATSLENRDFAPTSPTRAFRTSVSASAEILTTTSNTKALTNGAVMGGILTASIILLILLCLLVLFCYKRRQKRPKGEDSVEMLDLPNNHQLDTIAPSQVYR